MTIKKARKRGRYVKNHGELKRLHSPYDPLREADEIEIPEEKVDKYIIFGCGLGYLLRRLGKIAPGCQVLVLDPYPELIKEGGKREIWAAEPFESIQIIGPSTEDIMGALGDFIPLEDSSNYRVIRWRKYQHKVPDFFAPALSALQQLQKYQRVNLETLRLNGRDWLKNFRHNLTKIGNHKQIKFGGNPGNIALVAAGPSLDNQLDWLKTNRDKLTVISVNTAGPILKKHGIKADFHAAADSKSVVAEDLRHSNINNLFASPFLSPGILGEQTVNFSLLALKSPLCNWLQEADFLTSATAAGSVTVTVIDMLLNNCPGNIYLLGGDMEFKGNRYYARGTWREEKLLQKTNRFCSYLQAFLEWQWKSKNRQQEENPRLEDERNWLKNQGTQKDRLFIPPPLPSWWEGEQAPELLENPPQKIKLEPVDKNKITSWFQGQLHQFQEAKKGKETRVEWKKFIHWINKICESPQEELNNWQELLKHLASPQT